MPMMPEVRRMGAAWVPLQDRVRRYMESVGTDGVPLATFEEECLGAVFIPERPAILKALKSKKLVAPVRIGLAVRVYPRDKRPAPNLRRHGPDREAALDQFRRMLAPHMDRLFMAVTDASLDDAERRARQREACRQIGDLTARHLGRGLYASSLCDAVRSFHPDAVAVLARHEALFDPAAMERGTVKAAAPKPPKTCIPRNLPPHERIVAMVTSAGNKGLLISEIRKRFPHPRPKSTEIAVWLNEIVEADMIHCLKFATAKGLKPGLRYLPPHEGPDRIVNGVGYYDT